jgi:hypothetical protein
MNALRGEGGSVMKYSINDVPASPDEEERVDALDRIRTALRGLRFGTVTLVVQDGVVVQVERTEKIRLRGRELGGAS